MHMRRWRQISATRVRFTLSTAWATNTDGGPKTLNSVPGVPVKVGDRVVLTDTQGEKAVPLEFDYGDASATLSGARSLQAPYTPECQTSGGPQCLFADVREVFCASYVMSSVSIALWLLGSSEKKSAWKSRYRCAQDVLHMGYQWEVGSLKSVCQYKIVLQKSCWFSTKYSPQFILIYIYTQVYTYIHI